MNQKNRKINTLADLRLEKERIKIQLATKEDQLEESWGFLKQNYKGMIWQQINPFKNSNILSSVLGLLQPGLIPVITEVLKGTAKGSPVNAKVVGSAIKYAAANFGIKWLRKWLAEREMPDESKDQTND